MPLLDLFWTMLWFFMWIVWIWLVFALFADIFRSDDLSGWGKAAWVFFLIFVPYLGALVYLIMLTDVLSYILRALNWQGVFVVAWVGIALTHIVLTRNDRGIPEFRPGRLKALTPAVRSKL